MLNNLACFFLNSLQLAKNSFYRLLARTQSRGIARAIDWPVVRPTDASRSPRSKSEADSNAPTMDPRMMDLLNTYGFIVFEIQTFLTQGRNFAL